VDEGRGHSSYFENLIFVVEILVGLPQ
jgi:hypothetical protein